MDDFFHGHMDPDASIRGRRTSSVPRERQNIPTRPARGAALILVCVATLHAAHAADPAPSAPPSGVPPGATAPLPYWQAPPLPTAVVHGGAIPAGWQPQAVPYQGVAPDGRPLTMYFAPTYVFTYQAGPPFIATPPLNRGAPGAGPPVALSGWNYRAQGATAVPVALPPANVARYQPPPYQFPADARALSGTPIVPPATPLPNPSPAIPPASVAAPLPNQGWAAAAPAAAAAVPFAAAAALTSPNSAPSLPPPAPPTASLTPVAPIPSLPPAGPAPVTATPVSSLPAASPPAASASNTHLWKVVGVHDGDTVTCLDEANQQQKIRLAEIDAPEVSQDFGKVSREALAGMVFGKTIQVVDDGRDRYGRWIGHLYVDGLDVNRQMVATGMAWHYAAYSKDSSLGTLQSQAQAQRLGLWSQPNPTPPWEYRKNGKKKSA